MWKKKGMIYLPDGKNEFDLSHCHKPTPLIISDTLVRVYFGVRDENPITRTTFVDIDISNLESIKINSIHDKPILDIGKIGAFDDSGANVSSVLRVNNEVYMYYIGWNPSTTVHTRNSIGLAVSKDNGLSFSRMYDGSILDRNKNEPYYTGAVDVIFDEGIYKMWYTSGSEWKIINNKPEISYHIKYAESVNGIDWVRDNIDCILPSHEFEATARPCVIKEGGIYKMWYSKRNIDGFRDNMNKGYRGGYAESKDGKNWIRLDHLFGVDLSDKGWDSDSIAYPYVFKVKDKKIMLYNGNGFGKTGFGYAIYE
ncbi:hypothetical protein [Flavicella sp.]|uniref:hypothetical protein n=1 Tax=Flavicella sp. TaxID=2957742 RepID=UPI00262EA315|nr:hypothetical protein [Flavicella sp.]MDG1804990.1 hypothetical protein [Flavicella sp.]